MLASVRSILSNQESAEVEHLIAHDECPEALRTLAWIIVEEGKRVPRETIEAIRQLSEGLIDEKHMPDDLDSHVLE
ncbi:MAG: hypothetical protein GXX96_27040 [Planctomycetaceae bacterium]|nr:hypothetical protein [Planctomycetaceae bacterium]